MTIEKLLRMNALYEADKGGNGGDGDPQDKGEDADKDKDKGDGDTGDDPGKKDSDEPKFTQADLDRVIADRLAREKAQREAAEQKIRDDAERKRLDEQGEYKELADKLQKQLDAQKADVLKAKKEKALTRAGYSDEQATLLMKLIDGETDEDIEASVKTVKATVAPKKAYADPGAGNGTKLTPKKTDLHEKGKSAYQRLKEKGKIRGKK